MSDIDLTKVPTWLLALGVFGLALAVIWVFVWPGRGIELNASYYGPNRFVAVFDEKEQKKLKAFADSISEIDGARICFRKSNWTAIDCFENGNVTAHFDKSPRDNDRVLQDAFPK